MFMGVLSMLSVRLNLPVIITIMKPCKEYVYSAIFLEFDVLNKIAWLVLKNQRGMSFMMTAWKDYET